MKYILVDEDFQQAVLQKLNNLERLLPHLNLTSNIQRDPGLMDTADAIAYMKVTRRTLYKYRTRIVHPLPHKKLDGGKIYYWRDDIDNFLKSEKLDNG